MTMAAAKNARSHSRFGPLSDAARSASMSVSFMEMNIGARVACGKGM